MDTERLKSGKPAQAKGGKDSTKIVLTAAGAVAVGAGAAGAAVAANEWNNDAPEEQTQSQNVTEENAQETTTGQTGQHVEQQGSVGNQVQNQQNQQNQQTSTEIHPVDNNQTVEQNTETTQQTVEQETGSTQQTGNETAQEVPDKDDPPYDPIDDVDPDLIAQELIGEQIDPNDVDEADMVTIDGMDTYYSEDGTEIPVAMVHDENNEQYLMVDIDDDMTFDMIVDMEGNPVAPVDGNLTMSDVLDMFDETGGELAYNEEQIEQELEGSEDPEQDIIDTNDLAMLDRDSEEMAAVTSISEEEFEDSEDDDDIDDDLAEEDIDDGEMIDDLEA